jgi:hypothetical protein
MRDLFGVATPTSHGSPPNQWLETHAGATAFGAASASLEKLLQPRVVLFASLLNLLFWPMKAIRIFRFCRQ